MSTNTNSPPPASLPGGGTRYFHLLWDTELDDLRPVLESVQKHRNRVLEHWYQLYVLHFDDRRALTKTEFMEIFGSELDATLKDLLDKDMDHFAADVDANRRAAREARRAIFGADRLDAPVRGERRHRVSVVSPTNAADIPAVRQAESHPNDRARGHVLPVEVRRLRSADPCARTRGGALPNHSRSSFHGLVGASATMRQLYDQVEAAGVTRGTILIVGESGTGKELVARAIHECGPQPTAPFVALNCAAIPKDLIESELFGYKRGAFSGANADYLGLFRAADGGTLFLDEVTEMSADTQSKLLRAIQERTVRPVGSTKEVAVDVRLIASTNRDPEEAVKAGRLREDLYYRLQASVIQIPPLRERLEDIPLLVEHFIELFNAKADARSSGHGSRGRSSRGDARYSWPGNVRELANAIEAAFTFGRSQMIRLQDLPASISGSRAPERVAHRDDKSGWHFCRGRAGPDPHAHLRRLKATRCTLPSC